MATIIVTTGIAFVNILTLITDNNFALYEYSIKAPAEQKIAKKTKLSIASFVQTTEEILSKSKINKHGKK